MISNLILWTEEKGINNYFYWGFMGLGFIAAFVYNLINCKHFNLSKTKTAIVTLIEYVIGFLWMMFVTWVDNGFQEWGGINIVRIFVWIPVIMWPVVKLFKIDWKTWLDFTGPSILCLLQGVAHFGCAFAGCCHGYRLDHGIYNPALHYHTFPIQFIEAFVALSIAIFLFIRHKKRNYKVDGSTYSLMLILFGSTRFILEFFRDNNKLFLGLSDLALHALFMTLVGCAVHFTIISYNKSKKKKEA